MQLGRLLDAGIQVERAKAHRRFDEPLTRSRPNPWCDWFETGWTRERYQVTGAWELTAQASLVSAGWMSNTVSYEALQFATSVCMRVKRREAASEAHVPSFVAAAASLEGEDSSEPPHGTELAHISPDRGSAAT